ncbi:hypothetical protein ANCDUO_09003 [Ancylostoma duodenale]|uniref:Uncharacterized protein n=1 Tax=Ancylostoma duodenale TaxID=51022 RepID=A0A0C2GNS0_9BILA|nr:hypothetical protein ANCDUO_09003 [Ancylostoma duodenale]
MAEISYDLFQNQDISSMGLWLYGYTEKFTSLDESLDNMRCSYELFINDLYDIEYNNRGGKPLSTAKAIETLNNLEDGQNRVNCLIFFSAQENTAKLPRLDPDKSKFKIDTIVGVGFSGTNLHKVVTPQGVAVSVPYSYSERDVERVVAAVLGRIPTVSTTTQEPTTTEPEEVVTSETTVTTPSTTSTSEVTSTTVTETPTTTPTTEVTSTTTPAQSTTTSTAEVTVTSTVQTSETATSETTVTASTSTTQVVGPHQLSFPCETSFWVRSKLKRVN